MGWQTNNEIWKRRGLGNRSEIIPITSLQKSLGKLLAKNRHEKSYLAGGVALLIEPNTTRISQDMDYFHDSENLVAKAFEDDKKLLEKAGYKVQIDLNQPGYIRALVRSEKESTKIEWAKDSNWRFMPVEKSEEFGFRLHPIDTATNKLLALAGRDEARDLLDVLYIHDNILELGPLIWASVSKDPGFSPHSLLEMLRRRGKLQPEDIKRLNLIETPNLTHIKEKWLEAQASAADFILSRTPDEVGCLYYSPSKKRFVNPVKKDSGKYQLHFAQPGGVIPKIGDYH